MDEVISFRQVLTCIVVTLCLSLAGNASAADSKDVKDTPVSNLVPPGAAYVYNPPLRGAPGARVGGGTRGTAGQAAKLDVLAPDHVGLTVQAQPVLYWYAHAPSPVRFRFALTDDAIDPVLEFETESRQISGIQSLDLRDHEVSLQPGIAYHWSVALVTDAGNRSADIVSTGMIERIVPGEGLTSRIDSNTGTNLVSVFASEGIWYDALAMISDMIATAPGDDSLAVIRDSLLEQVGLPAAVE